MGVTTAQDSLNISPLGTPQTGRPRVPELVMLVITLIERRPNFFH